MDANVYGRIDGKGFRFGIVRARFNEGVTNGLLTACVRELKSAAVREEDIEIVEVPGCVEVPYALQEQLLRSPFDAVIALGAIIKGGTPHFELVSDMVHQGIADLSLKHRIPVIAGVITCFDLDQALERSGEGPLNRGVEAAQVALEMAKLRQSRAWHGI